MTKFILWCIVLMALSIAAAAQTNPAHKADTAKHKDVTSPKPKEDTLNKKVPINLQNEKLAKSDSAFLKLSPKKGSKRKIETDSADVALLTCDFEKDANAMILTDQAAMAVAGGRILAIRYRRIKIFNEYGKNEANIRIELNNKFGAEQLIAIEGRTINLVNNKVDYTTLDQKLVYSQHTDKSKDMVIFSFPNVKAGSVVEYTYVWSKQFSRSFPEWSFQNDIPTRYSELNVFLNPFFNFDALYRTSQPFVKDTVAPGGFGHVWAMANVPPSKIEPYMRSEADGRQSITLLLKSVVGYNGQTEDISGSWATVGKQIAEDKEVSKPFDEHLSDESDIIKQVTALKTEDQKIAFLFNLVKTQMKWNEEKYWLSKDGIKAAWKKKSGNWGEVNMVLCHLLKQSGIKAYPMLVSTRDNGIIVPGFANFFQINKLVTYVPVDTAKFYVLDATNKYNTYNEIPFELLNSNGLYLNKDKGIYDLVFLKKTAPVKEVVFITAEIKPDGSMTGTTQINNFSYGKATSLELHKTLDEKKYDEYLTGNDNNLKITSLKLENAEVDSLPLTQTIEFKLDLPGTDDKYIYFNPNLFTTLHTNPFMNETRSSDIDFGSRNTYSINGRYKMPAGYKVESLPKNMTLLMPDKSISFKRLVEQEGDAIVVFYVINYKNAVYARADYPELYNYFKKMDEILNEQIVLKKL